MVILVDDCGRIFVALTAKGVEFTRELAEYTQGASATFSNPTGNLFSIRGLPQRRA